MRKSLTIGTFMAVLGLAACGDTDLERGISGAAIGAGAATVTGGDAVTGAVIGGAAGVFCDDLTPELCN